MSCCSLTNAALKHSQTMTNVMGSTDPASCVVEHSLQSQPRLNAEEHAFLASVTHDALYDMPWDSRSASFARDGHPSIIIVGQRLATLKAIANHFCTLARAQMSCPRTCVLSATFLRKGFEARNNQETVHAMLDLIKRLLGEDDTGGQTRVLHHGLASVMRARMATSAASNAHGDTQMLYEEVGFRYF
ncbi:unnamed protein product [Symbiodinium microadriaticum]|nr:unnamed protein product [Symbiodinium microadriaticum]